jgi:arylformamidase
MNRQTLSQAERDAAYNSAAAHDVPAWVAQRNALACAYRAAHLAHLDIAYGAGARTQWDIFPSANQNAPCLIFIHGGYWQMNRREDFAHLAAGVAAHGWSVALPGYTLAPQATLAQIVAELTAALDWLQSHAAAAGLGRTFYLSGWSAGAHLTAVLLDHPSITAGLAISGVFELGPIRDTYLNDKLQLSDAEIATLSPRRSPPPPKPLAIAYGTAELPALVRDSRDLHAKRAAAHAPGPLLPIPHADHFTVLDALRHPAGALTKCLLGFE